MLFSRRHRYHLCRGRLPGDCNQRRSLLQVGSIRDGPGGHPRDTRRHNAVSGESSLANNFAFVS